MPCQDARSESVPTDHPGKLRKYDWAAMPNIFEPEFDEVRDADGFRAKRARIGYQLGTTRIGLSLLEVPPGQAAYPYHFHLAEEEALIALSGRPRHRTEEGGVS